MDSDKAGAPPVERRPDWSKARWRKSTYSADAACVEVAKDGGFIGVRDTKDGSQGPILVFDEREWRAFLAGVRSGEFSLEALDA